MAHAEKASKLRMIQPHTKHSVARQKSGTVTAWIVICYLAFWLSGSVVANAYVNFAVSKVIGYQYPKVHLLANFYSNNTLVELVEPGQLEIYVNDIKIKNNSWSITPLKKSSESILIMLGIDNGNSVPRNVLDDFVWVVSQLAGKKGKNDAVSVTGIAGNGGREKTLHKETAKIVNTVNSVVAQEDGAKLYDFIVESINSLDKQGSLLKYVVVASGGKDVGSKNTYDDVINLSRKFNIPVTIIGLAEKDDYNKFSALAKLAHLTGGEFTVVRDKNEMIQTYAAYVANFLKQQVMTINLGKQNPSTPVKIEICFKSNTDSKFCKDLVVEAAPGEGALALPKGIAGRDEPAEVPQKASGPASEPAKAEGNNKETKKEDANYAYYFLVAALLIVALAIVAKQIKAYYAARKIKEQFKNKPDVSGRMSNNNFETIVDPGGTISYLLEIPSENKEIKLFKDSLAIGSIDSNDIVIKDKFVSRKHAMLKFVDNQWTVLDLNSTNGVYVNDAKVNKSQPLHHNDNIKIGNTIIRFYLKNS